ncbi:MAG: hypothetical protein JWO98_82 [Frankiales bacterium]|nr:hypothetical protein [Frankiales bacterium]
MSPLRFARGAGRTTWLCIVRACAWGVAFRGRESAETRRPHPGGVAVSSLRAGALRGLRRLVDRTSEAPGPRLTAFWEGPERDDLRAGQPLRLSGWAHTDGSDVPRISVLLDGVVVAGADAAQPRQDVHQHFGGRGRAGGWAIDVPTSVADRGARLEVLATDGLEDVSAGTAPVLEGNAKPIGHLDGPADGSRVRVGGVISVAGWVLFGGQPADRVEVFVGGEPAIPLRRGEARPDVSDSIDLPTAIASGFTGVVPVSDRWRGEAIDFVVRAHSVQGEVWTSNVARIRVEDRPKAAGEMDELSLDVLWPGYGRPGREVGTKLRVCVFTHSLNLGGGELYLQELLLRLRREYPVELIVISPLDGPLKLQLRKAGIPVHITDAYSVRPDHYLGRVSELATLVRTWDADVVLVNTLGEFAPVDAAVESDVPVVWAIHESFELPVFSHLVWGENGLYPEVDRRWRKCLAVAHTVFEADATLEMFQEQVPGLQGRRIQYGIDVAEIARYRSDHDRDRLRADLGFEPSNTILLCMGVFQPRKSQLALVVAFSQLVHLFPEARLVLVGDHPSPYGDAVRAAVAELGLEDQIRLIPIEPDTYRWYHVADVMISASDTESLPRSVLEAMAFGLPTMAADVWGLSEVIRDGVNGWLCQARSGNALTVGIRRALECPAEERQRISAACLADSSMYDGAHYPAKYFQLMTTLVAAHRSGEAHLADRRTMSESTDLGREPTGGWEPIRREGEAGAAMETGTSADDLDQVGRRVQAAEAALREMSRLRDKALQAAADLDSRLQEVTVQLENQRAVAANAARERDDFGMRLIHAEERSAAPLTMAAVTERETLRRRLDETSERLSELEREMLLIRRTVSWRVTRPLRSVRTVLGGRGGR